MNRTLTAAIFCAALAALTGCGQMGPLYMPEPEQPAGAQPGQSPQPSQLSAQKPAEN